MQQLIKLLEKWNYEYNVLNKPTVADQVYDQTFQELKELEVKYDFVLPDSPTQKLGASVIKKFHPFKHKTPMLSLESTDKYEELVKFEERVKKKLGLNQIEYLCELKIDGLSASLHYSRGELNKLVTRDLPKKLPEETASLEIRGEIYLQKVEFQRLNKELIKKGLSPLANPRNAAAGTVRTLIPTQQRKLNFFAYQILGTNVCQNLEEVQAYFQEIKQQRDHLEFEIDGIVIKVNAYEHYEKLGQTNRFPRWAMAYKFPASVALSQIEDIQVEITRSGRVSYVAQIAPVSLLGSKISKATLHNY
ncbi:4693_t:CDS:2, partial [Funneliformis caledonium]